MKSVMLLFLLSFTYQVRWISLPNSQEPVYVVRGLAGEMWVGGGPSIESISCTGKIMTYQVGTDVRSLTLDGSGSVWFSADYTTLGFIAHGKITFYQTPSNIDSPHSLIYYRGMVRYLARGVYGTIDAKGHIKEYKFPGIFQADDMQEGPDGNLWLTDTRHSQIGKFTPDHNLTVYKSPVVPVFITKGPDEAMWFDASGVIGRISMKGVITTFRSLALQDNAGAITAGSDGALWYSGPGNISRMTTNGKEIGVAGLGSRNPTNGIATGYGNTIWFTAFDLNKVGIVSV